LRFLLMLLILSVTACRTLPSVHRRPPGPVIVLQGACYEPARYPGEQGRLIALLDALSHFTAYYGKTATTVENGATRLVSTWEEAPLLFQREILIGKENTLKKSVFTLTRRGQKRFFLINGEIKIKSPLHVLEKMAEEAGLFVKEYSETDESVVVRLTIEREE